MAGSRLERIGTIYSRTTGLIQSGALSWEDRPIWYDIYKAFPPKEEPRYDRPAPKIELKKIFYEEDKIRALFHRNNKQIGVINFLGNNKTLTQKFIETYRKLEQQYKDGATEEQLYTEAIDILNKERGSRKQEVAENNDDEPISLSLAFKEAQKQQKDDSVNLKLKDIFQS